MMRSLHILVGEYGFCSSFHLLDLGKVLRLDSAMTSVSVGFVGDELIDR